MLSEEIRMVVRLYPEGRYRDCLSKIHSIWESGIPAPSEDIDLEYLEARALFRLGDKDACLERMRRMLTRKMEEDDLIHADRCVWVAEKMCLEFASFEEALTVLSEMRTIRDDSIHRHILALNVLISLKMKKKERLEDTLKFLQEISYFDFVVEALFKEVSLIAPYKSEELLKSLHHIEDQLGSADKPIFIALRNYIIDRAKSDNGTSQN